MKREREDKISMGGDYSTLLKGTQWQLKYYIKGVFLKTKINFYDQDILL